MSELSEDALRLLIDTAKDSAVARSAFDVVPIKEMRKVALVNGRAGTYELKGMEPPARDHNLLTIADVVGFSKTFEPDSPYVWIGDKKITVTLDDNRVSGDIGTYGFVETAEFQKLSQLSKQGTDSEFQQVPLIKLLRTTFWDNFQYTTHRDDLISSLRKVSATQTSEVSQGRGTYDATMIDKTGISLAWPDRLSMRCNVFTDDSIVASEDIDVVFEVDANRKVFCLWPTVSSLRKAREAARNHATEMIREQLKDTSCVVFCGNPTND